MKLEELPEISSEPFENHHGGEVLVVTRAEIVYHPQYSSSHIATQLVYVAGMFSISKLLPHDASPELFDERFLICSNRVQRYLDGTATFHVSLRNFMLHAYPTIKSIASFVPFEISGEPLVTSSHWERFDPTKTYEEE